MEESGLIEEPAGAEDVKVRVKYEVIAECLDTGDGGEIELKSHPVAEGFFNTRPLFA